MRLLGGQRPESRKSCIPSVLILSFFAILGSPATNLLFSLAIDVVLYSLMPQHELCNPEAHGEKNGLPDATQISLASGCFGEI
jgi:hypothetical protein